MVGNITISFGKGRSWRGVDRLLSGRIGGLFLYIRIPGTLISGTLFPGKIIPIVPTGDN